MTVCYLTKTSQSSSPAPRCRSGQFSRASTNDQVAVERQQSRWFASKSKGVERVVVVNPHIWVIRISVKKWDTRCARLAQFFEEMLPEPA